MKSVLRAGGMRFATFPLTALATFLTARVIIGSEGPEVYGLVMLVASLFLFLPFADLGTGTAVVNALSDSTLPREKASSTVAQVFRWLVISGTVIILLGVLGGVTGWWSTLLGVSGSFARDLNTAAALSIAIFGLSVPVSIGQRILVGLGRSDRAVLLASAASVVTLATTWLLTRTDASPLLIAAATPLGVLACQALQYISGVRMLGESLLFPLTHREKGTTARSILSQAGPMLIILVAAPIMLQGHRLILTRVGTPGQLAEYSLAMQLYTPLFGFISTASMALWPMFGNIRHDAAASRSLFVKASALFAFVGVCGGAGMVVFGDFLARLISKGEISLGFWTLLSFAALIFAQSLQQVPGMFLTTARGLMVQSAMVVTATVATMILSPIFISKFGVAGPSFATAIALVLFMILPCLWFVANSHVLHGKDSAVADTVPDPAGPQGTSGTLETGGTVETAIPVEAPVDLHSGSAQETAVSADAPDIVKAPVDLTKGGTAKRPAPRRAREKI